MIRCCLQAYFSSAEYHDFSALVGLPILLAERDFLFKTFYQVLTL